DYYCQSFDGGNYILF
nr:immunoglobulin light chain junction region [Macaca mulatta]MOY15243.1 immunoglobulin light chain junction region [Macaca mulatta]MOY15250.1 immunoglobulin light chain junction region [Macaca mulatta]